MVKFNMIYWKRIFYILEFILYATHFTLARSLDEPVKTSKCEGEAREILQQLRSQMQSVNATNGMPIQAYYIPMHDAHQNEYIADHDKRLQYITKFTGSGGEAIVTMQNAALWTDSRYHQQAEQQLDLNCWSLMKQGQNDVPTISQWLISMLPKNSTVGVDPTLITASGFRNLETQLNLSGHDFISISSNLVDNIWISRPAFSKNPIIPLDIQYTGKESNLKIAEVLDKVKLDGGESIVITTLDDIAWLLNLRGSDIKYNPVFFSYIILTADKYYLFVDQEKLQQEAKRQIVAEKADIIVRDYEEIFVTFAAIVNGTTGKIITSTSASQAISNCIPTERRIEKNIVALLKTVKNHIEAENMKKSHIRDGFALIQYLHWLNATIDHENITEISGAAKLTQFRAQQDNFRGISFEVISAVGEHAAMAHYSPTVESVKRITRDELYLVDSGGQYWDGTTDITRTVHFGIPTAKEKMCYTRVLKGFIAVVTSIFKKSTPLNYFDQVARRALWQEGLDYGHGSGHGVGMYLYVHEYPPLINGKSTDTLQENIFTSNEPGYYKENEFGIRIEDVIQVIKSDLKGAFDGEGALTFKSITYAPLQTNLIDTDLLNKEEAKYVNNYNKMVLDTVGPILLKHRLMDAYQWLQHETRQICSWAK